MLAAHLAADPPIHAVLFERDTFARGLAYSTPSPRHLLNLAAAKMSAFPDRPQDFVEWLGTGDADAYVARWEYAIYLRSVFERAVSHAAAIQCRPESVVALEPEAGGFRVVSDSGAPLLARCAVLAVGLFPPSEEMVDAVARRSPRYLPNPWAFPYEDLFGEVLLIGSGLTAIDVLVELHHRGFGGRVTAVSRHGLLPQPHAQYGEPVNSAIERHSVLATFRSVRDAIARVENGGGDWRAVVDGLRPQSQAIWQGWTLREKQRFLRHVRPYWETSRRRVPPQAYQKVRAMERGNTLRRITGRIQSVAVQENSLFAVAVERAGEVTWINSDWIINCTGPRNDVTRIVDPLMQSLLGQGLVAAHPTGLGIAATPHGRVIGSDENPAANLFATGALLRGVLYESISVAELSGQMKALANLVRETALRFGGAG